jgi:hypothetical protein
MTQFIDQRVLDRLDDLERDDVEPYFCWGMFGKKRCPKANGGNCETCFPILKVLSSEELDTARNRKAVIHWRLKQYVLGEMDVHVAEPKKHPNRWDYTIDPTHNASEIVQRLGG